MNIVLIIIGVLILAFSVLYLAARSKMKNIADVEDNESILTLSDKNFQHQTRNRIVLVDFWAGWCVPCKMMAPILEELKSEYAGKLQVVFIDVWQNPDASKEHGINMIPTQLFFDAEGKELFRHEGFFSKEDILNKWKELGVELPSPSAS